MMDVLLREGKDDPQKERPCDDRNRACGYASTKRRASGLPPSLAARSEAGINSPSELPERMNPANALPLDLSASEG